MKYALLLLFLLSAISGRSEPESSPEMSYSMEGEYCVIRNSRGDIQMKGKLIDGKKEGEWVLWDSQGTKIGEFSYENGLLSGTTKLYYSKFSYPKHAGNLKAQFDFASGIRNGRSNYYAPNGDLQITFKVIDGKPKTNFLNKSEIYGRLESDDRYIKTIEQIIRETVEM